MRSLLTAAVVALLVSVNPVQAQQATVLMSLGVAIPTGQLGREVDAGLEGGALARFSKLPFIPMKGVALGIEVDHARYGKQEGVDMNAVETRVNATLTHTFDIKPSRIALDLTGGIGLSLQTLEGPTLHSEWNQGFFVRGDIRFFDESRMVDSLRRLRPVAGVGIQYSDYGAFDSLQVSAKIGVKFNF